MKLSLNIFKMFLFYSFLISSVYGEVIDEIFINGNNRITNKTIQMFANIEIKDEIININERIDNLPFKRIIRAKMGIIQSHLKPKKIIIIKPNQLEGSKILKKPINKLPSL